MVFSKQTHAKRRYPMAVYCTPKEQYLIDEFFERNRVIKKGEKFKEWVLEGIAREGQAARPESRLPEGAGVAG